MNANGRVVTALVRMAATVFIAWIAGGCASQVLYTQNTVLPSDHAVVFGRVFAPRGNDPVVPRDFAVVVKHFPDETGPEWSEITKVNRNGYFYWHLPPGHYALEEVHWYMLEADVWGEFTVSRGQKALYLGTLHLAFHGTSYSYDISVEDHYETDVEALHTEFPAVTVEPVKSLMKPMPDRVEHSF